MFFEDLHPRPAVVSCCRMPDMPPFDAPRIYSVEDFRFELASATGDYGLAVSQTSFYECVEAAG